MTVLPAREAVRSASRTLLSVHHWKMRIVLWSAGAAVGAAAVGFALLADTARAGMPHSAQLAHRRALVLAGGAAGVPAAFNTPLAGIVFAIEELSRSFEERASGVALTAVILAGVISIALTGDYTYFGQPVVAAASRGVSVGVLTVAVTGGLAGGIFSRTTLLGVGWVRAYLAGAHRARPIMLAALLGLLVAALGYFCGDLTYGTGYSEARTILEGQTHLPWYYAPARAPATLAAYLSGVPAGLPAPSLSVGAGLGQAVSALPWPPQDRNFSRRPLYQALAQERYTS
jgi:H+/Cl- antiporter ClcA